MRIDWWTLGLQAINFLVLVGLLWRFLYRPVARTIARRKEETEKTLSDAAAATARAEEARLKYEADRAGWPAERERLVAEARTQIDAERKQGFEKAHAEAEALTVATREKLAEERAAALDHLRTRTVELGVEIAARLLQEAAAPAVAEVLLDRLAERLGALPIGELAALRAQVSNGHALQIVTAPRLDAEAEARWRRKFAERLGPGAHVEFGNDERLIAGAELHFPTTVFRLSWRDALDGARKELDRDAVA
jgi:F-type H+-transporting ATPase subunit b